MPSNFALYSGFLDDLYPSSGISGHYDTDPKGMEFNITTEPTVDVAMLTETKTFLTVNHDEHDSMIEGFISSATKDIEEYVGASIAKQTITAYWRYVMNYVILPRQPIMTITTVKEIGDDGTETTLTTDDYDAFGQDEKVIRFDWPVNNQVEVVYDAGFSDTYADLPQDLKDAVKWQTKLYYNNRSTGQDDFVAVDEQSGLVVQARTLVKKYRTWT